MKLEREKMRAVLIPEEEMTEEQKKAWESAKILVENDPTLLSDAFDFLVKVGVIK